jgi:hypothetical protein
MYAFIFLIYITDWSHFLWLQANLIAEQQKIDIQTLKVAESAVNAASLALKDANTALQAATQAVRSGSIPH